VSFTRAPLLTEIASSSSRFGPAKFAIACDSIGLVADLQLNLDGSFSVFVGTSHYDDDEARALHGLQLVRDTARVILPGVIAAYRSDGAWTPAARGGFRRSARARARAFLN
jgi:hypothetical protein